MKTSALIHDIALIVINSGKFDGEERIKMIEYLVSQEALAYGKEISDDEDNF